MRQVFPLLSAITVLILITLHSSGQSVPPADNYIVRPDFKCYFYQCQVDGSLVIFDHTKQQWIVSDTSSVHTRNLPASTFKIINLLIFLETKTIPDENYVVKWPGATDTVKYGYRPDIYHDISVKNAFELSAGWAFIELAKKINRNVYKDYLVRCGYGNADVSFAEADFWNFGPLGISPVEQIRLLKNLYDGKLPFSKKNMDIVKRVMITEQNRLHTIHSKTGWTMADGINTGWWVGYLEKKGNAYFFATRLLQNRSNNRADFSRCRKDITRSALKDLRILD
ncbi:penicillin-binding transpeptidase domain-containing protein [Niabella hibiscisoli]|uniref:penicillin-binding transpeptidase domain-containing protein n=1 Tax=Niabella hibiscisoli TaxID=1825928 RepID=UPI001F1040F6|nr:penicillin-binding transpeptidase domain-containing protein [Niabella hibiscisoli]MCH5719771.1 penicillin binding protein transpeptidase domain-containing protein [Niabella hibiscisoli]